MLTISVITLTDLIGKTFRMKSRKMILIKCEFRELESRMNYNVVSFGFINRCINIINSI